MESLAQLDTLNSEDMLFNRTSTCYLMSPSSCLNSCEIGYYFQSVNLRYTQRLHKIKSKKGNQQKEDFPLGVVVVVVVVIILFADTKYIV